MTNKVKYADPTPPVSWVWFSFANLELLQSAKFDDGVVLIADQREVCGSGRGKSEMKKLLEKFDKIDVEFVTLNISDFCFLRRNLGEISWKIMLL